MPDLILSFFLDSFPGALLLTALVLLLFFGVPYLIHRRSPEGRAYRLGVRHRQAGIRSYEEFLSSEACKSAYRRGRRHAKEIEEEMEEAIKREEDRARLRYDSTAGESGNRRP
jgi:hypothetical protein